MEGPTVLRLVLVCGFPPRFLAHMPWSAVPVPHDGPGRILARAQNEMGTVLSILIDKSCWGIPKIEELVSAWLDEGLMVERGPWEPQHTDVPVLYDHTADEWFLAYPVLRCGTQQWPIHEVVRSLRFTPECIGAP